VKTTALYGRRLPREIFLADDFGHGNLIVSREPKKKPQKGESIYYIRYSLQIERNRAGNMCRGTKAVEYTYKSARRAKLINGQGEMQPKKCDEKYVHDGRIKSGKKKKKRCIFSDLLLNSKCVQRPRAAVLCIRDI
jgi:hypothetical protein